MILNEDNSLLNRAEYYFNFYKSSGEIDYLSGAISFLSDYRKNGGKGFEGTETKINRAILELCAKQNGR